MEVEIILPEVNHDELTDGLIRLTEKISQKDEDIYVAHGFLGGEFGYGAIFENDVFEMFPFYWGDCNCGFDGREEKWSKIHNHTKDCYRNLVDNDLVAKGWAKDEYNYLNAPEALSWDEKEAIVDKVRKKWCGHFGLSFPGGCAVHCTCDYEPQWNKWIKVNCHTDDCLLVVPNFKHKETGLEVRWYKYIGRGMETTGIENLSIPNIIEHCILSL